MSHSFIDEMLFINEFKTVSDLLFAKSHHAVNYAASEH